MKSWCCSVLIMYMVLFGRVGILCRIQVSGVLNLLHVRYFTPSPWCANLPKIHSKCSCKTTRSVGKDYIFWVFDILYIHVGLLGVGNIYCLFLKSILCIYFSTVYVLIYSQDCCGLERSNGKWFLLSGPGIVKNFVKTWQKVIKSWKSHCDFDYHMHKS